MGKIIRFTPTGEVRRPTQYEWFENEDGGMSQAKFTYRYKKYPIYTRTEDDDPTERYTAALDLLAHQMEEVRKERDGLVKERDFLRQMATEKDPLEL